MDAILGYLYQVGHPRNKGTDLVNRKDVSPKVAQSSFAHSSTHRLRFDSEDCYSYKFDLIS